MNDDKTFDGICWGIVLAMLVGITIGVTYTLTRKAVQREAVANGHGHWTIVQESVEFAWGAP